MFLYALGATEARSGDRTRAIATLEDALRQASRLGQKDLSTTIEQDLAKLRKSR